MEAHSRWKRQVARIVEINCTSPLNLKSTGVVTVTVVGRSNISAVRIDPMSVRLEGVAPKGFAIEDVASPIGHRFGKRQIGRTNGNRPDGIDDLILEFDPQEIARALGDLNGDRLVVLELTGMLKDGTPIHGEDIVLLPIRNDG